MPNLGLRNQLTSSSSIESIDYWVTFDGEDDTIDLPVSYNGTFKDDQDFSISAWIFKTDTGNIFATGNISEDTSACRFSVGGTDKLSFYFGGTSKASNAALSDSTW